MIIVIKNISLNDFSFLLYCSESGEGGGGSVIGIGTVEIEESSLMGRLSENIEISHGCSAGKN